MTKKQWWKLIGKKCPKCNGEGFIRDYDGTWLEDCDCEDDCIKSSISYGPKIESILRAYNDNKELFNENNVKSKEVIIREAKELIEQAKAIIGEVLG